MGISWKTDERLLGIGRFDHQPAGAGGHGDWCCFCREWTDHIGRVYGIYFLQCVSDLAGAKPGKDYFQI